VADLKTNEERRAAGRARRVDVPRSSHAAGYADQTVEDHAALQLAVADGRIEAVIDR
jgi:hypothetical protein